MSGQERKEEERAGSEEVDLYRHERGSHGGVMQSLLGFGLGRSGPILKPGTVCVRGMNGFRKGMHTT